MNKRKLFFIYLSIVIFSLIIRFWRVQTIPPVISHDESFYPVQAKTLSVNGHGLNGIWKPSSLTAEVELYAELPGLIMMPAAKLLPNQPILAAKITHIILGTAIIFILSALAFALTKQHSFAIFTALIASVNPWLFQFSRMGFDSMFSLFFYLTALLIFIKAKNWHKIWAFPIFFLGFFQYQGLKVIFLPIVFIASFYNWQKKENSWPTLIVLIVSILLFVFYLQSLRFQTSGNRLNFLIFNDHEYINQQVNLNRQQSLNNPWKNLYSNKLTVVGLRFVEQYINSLDLKQWFFSLDVVRNPFAVYQHGLFYPQDLFLIVLGLIFLWQKKSQQKMAFLLTCLLLIAPLPAAIVSTGNWLVFRVSFLVPIYILLIAFAINQIAKKWPRSIFLGVIIIYFLFTTRFFYEYFYRYPILGTRDQYFSEKIIAQYIKRNPKKNIIIIAPEPIFVFNEILIFNNLINQKNIDSINKSFQTKNYQLENFQILGERCIPNNIDKNTIYISHSNVRPCDESNDFLLDYTQIPSLIDGGGVYRIYQDSYCGDLNLARFPNLQNNVFALNKLSQEDFCKNFIIRN